MAVDASTSAALVFQKARVGFARLSRLLIDGTQQRLAELDGILTFPCKKG